MYPRYVNQVCIYFINSYYVCIPYMHITYISMETMYVNQVCKLSIYTMDIYNVCRYLMYMYTMYPYSLCMLLCTMCVDYLCISGMNSMYLYYIAFFLLGRWGESTPPDESFLLLLPPKKIPPSRLTYQSPTPHEMFIPPSSRQKSIPLTK